MIKNNIIICLAIAVLFFGYRSCNLDSKLNSKSNVVAYLQDSLKTYKDREGRFVAERKVLEGSLEDIKSTTKLVNNKPLQELTKTKGITHGSTISTETRIDTVTYVRVDTIQGKCYFKDSIENEYLSLKETLQGDSMYRSISFKDTISYALVEAKNGTIVRIKNESIYARTNNVHSFTVAKRKRSLAGRILEYSLVAIATFMIAK